MSTCKVCEKQGDLMKCGGCKIAAYCSTVCQRADWPVHKPACQYAQEPSTHTLEGGIFDSPPPARVTSVQFPTGNRPTFSIPNPLVHPSAASLPTSQTTPIIFLGIIGNPHDLENSEAYRLFLHVPTTDIAFLATTEYSPNNRHLRLLSTYKSFVDPLIGDRKPLVCINCGKAHPAGRSGLNYVSTYNSAREAGLLPNGERPKTLNSVWEVVLPFCQGNEVCKGKSVEAALAMKGRREFTGEMGDLYARACMDYFTRVVPVEERADSGW
ncbi:hypothetical protein BJ508DRAFT_305886 [Ascobolus immersus RN42]|uniref:MYND-type domain-containing protein n=1 Tax=Ascobolus immersus RN42 TaxID=1160509 RepID=A0A3N4I824_ASCIM|nr:hypothetical protein BJ508DRAFT_305886 [Ascobolus immersus RN42]